MDGLRVEAMGKATRRWHAHEGVGLRRRREVCAEVHGEVCCVDVGCGAVWCGRAANDNLKQV